MPLQKLEPQIKLTITNPHAEGGSSAAFGPGIAALCRGVKNTGSLNASAKDMHMAYSKAWRIIKETEDALEIQLLIRDGAHGSTLTEDALALLDAYDRLADSLKDSSCQAYKKIIGE